MRNVAGEAAGAMHGDGLRGVAGVIDDVDLARLNHMEFEVALPDRKQRVTIPVRSDRRLCTRAEFRDLGLVEGRKRNGLKILFGHNSPPWGKGPTTPCRPSAPVHTYAGDVSVAAHVYLLMTRSGFNPYPSIPLFPE